MQPKGPLEQLIENSTPSCEWCRAEIQVKLTDPDNVGAEMEKVKKAGSRQNLCDHHAEEAATRFGDLTTGEI